MSVDVLLNHLELFLRFSQSPLQLCDFPVQHSLLLFLDAPRVRD